MFRKETINAILKKAATIDCNCELFGSQTHQYRLNPSIDVSDVRKVEAEYNFTLPEDYFRFITEIGDGGAGVDYGINPFTSFLIKGRDEYANKYLEAYRRGISKPFIPRPMTTGEVGDYGFTNKAYENNPANFFVFEEYFEEDNENIPCANGFFVIGTHGCQWDFGIIVTGERRGQVFDTDNEGGYCFLANNFHAFYQQWLDQIADTKSFERKLEARKNLFSRKNNSIGSAGFAKE